MTGLCVRAYRAADAGALASIFHRAVQIGSAGGNTQAQHDDWSPKVMEADTYRTRLQDLATFVAVADGAPQGFLSLDPPAHVDLLFVAPEWTRQGVARALYLHLLDHARAQGLTRLTVEANAMSAPFFRRQGWSATGTETRGTGAAAVVNMLMAVDLPPS